MKYPLSPGAKTYARELLAAYKVADIEQTFLVVVTAIEGTFETMYSIGIKNHADPVRPTLGVIRELCRYGLLHLEVSDGASESGVDGIYEITVLQELENAVNSDFDVSEFFLALNSVGTIVQGNLTIQPGAMFQSNAKGSNMLIQGTGNVVADRIENLIPVDIVDKSPNLQASLHDLRETSDRATIRLRMGRVVTELGRCIELNNFDGAVAALDIIAEALRHL